MAAMACMCLMPSCPTCGRSAVLPLASIVGGQSTCQIPMGGQASWQATLVLSGPRSMGGASEPAATTCMCFMPSCPLCKATLAPPMAPPEVRMKRKLAEDLREDSGDEMTDYMAELRKVMAAVPDPGYRMNPSGVSCLPTWDFLEIWAGCGNLSEAVARAGCGDLRVGPSLDILEHTAFRQVPRYRLNLLDDKDTTVLWQVLHQARPKWIHCAPPCTYWTQLGRLTAKRTKAEWISLHEEASRHLRLACQIALWSPP